MGEKVSSIMEQKEQMFVVLKDSFHISVFADGRRRPFLDAGYAVVLYLLKMF